jgi:hypothetical protein
MVAVIRAGDFIASEIGSLGLPCVRREMAARRRTQSFGRKTLWS